MVQEASVNVNKYQRFSYNPAILLSASQIFTPSQFAAIFGTTVQRTAMAYSKPQSNLDILSIHTQGTGGKKKHYNHCLSF